ncbi:MAG: gamma-glutamylcyclotransferase [Pseudomonadota bacterium]
MLRPIEAVKRKLPIPVTATDPFRHHPELRDKIKPAELCFFRDLDMEVLDQQLMDAGYPRDWRTPCAIRERNRQDFLQAHMDRDLWVFAYGSLMWDPGIEFAEVRKAHCEGYQRCFCLWDEGGRGSPEAPALMLAIDDGAECEGLAYRIDASKLDHETFVLFRREMIAEAYRPTWMPLTTADGTITALGFVANHDNERIRPDLTLSQQASMIAVATGLLGSNFDYLSDTCDHLQLLGITDPYLTELIAQTIAARAKADLKNA